MNLLKYGSSELMESSRTKRNLRLAPKLNNTAAQVWRLANDLFGHCSHSQ
jgi:hypothetical protein